MRAAIYARFSTDLQSVASIDDQTRVCRERANTLGLTVVIVHSDCAVSGVTPVCSAARSKCLRGGRSRRSFRCVLVESLDRLSRNLVEHETVIRRLEHRGIRIVGASDGYDTASGAGRKLLRGVCGLISETYLDDLRAKTHRGLTGQIERGYHAGGSTPSARVSNACSARSSASPTPSRRWAHPRRSPNACARRGRTGRAKTRKDARSGRAATFGYPRPSARAGDWPGRRAADGCCPRSGRPARRSW